VLYGSGIEAMIVETGTWRSEGWLAAFQCGWLTVAFCALTTLGCASSRHPGSQSEKTDAIVASRPPSFLSGPVSLLLTNREDFHARVVITETNANRSTKMAGNLFQQEGHLMFFPTSEQSSAQRGLKTYRFLWDARLNRGEVVSEAVNGYASVVAPVRYTSIVSRSSTPPIVEPIQGQPCVEEEVTVTSGGGRTAGFRVWRAVEAESIPLRIASISDANTIQVELSEISVERLSWELFSPPAGFVKYDSVDAMNREVVRRPRVMPYTHGNSAGGR
jgi:hypothetical protein